MISILGATATHVGQVRDMNQDRAFYSGTIAAVADGMGGHAGGEVASALAIAEVSGVRRTLDLEGFHQVIEAANQRIFDAALAPELRGMGTTLVGATLDAEAEIVHVVNVGDSRGYLVRDSEISQVTHDHSLVEDLVRQGAIDSEEARIHPQRNIVTRALGISDQVTIDTFPVKSKPGDRFVLCSDGLSDEISDDEICSIALAHTSPSEAADALVAAAVAAGGKDNVTVAVLIVTEHDGTASADIFDDQRDVGLPTEVGVQPILVEPPDNSPAASPTTQLVGNPDAPPEGTSVPWRGLGVVFAVLAIFGLGTAATSWYATSAWFVDEQAGEVVILQGRPGGLLFWKPTVEAETGIDSSSLDDASAERLKAKTILSSFAEAQELVDNLVVDPENSES